MLGRMPPTWDAMKCALLAHFLPPDHEERCYSAWYIKQDGLLQEFHTKFLEALLKLPDLMESAKLARYYDVVDRELVLGIKQRNPTMLHEAMHAAMVLHRYKATPSVKPASSGLPVAGSSCFQLLQVQSVEQQTQGRPAVTSIDSHDFSWRHTISAATAKLATHSIQHSHRARENQFFSQRIVFHLHL